jgi:hypothetical protein
MLTLFKAFVYKIEPWLFTHHSKLNYIISYLDLSTISFLSKPPTHNILILIQNTSQNLHAAILLTNRIPEKTLLY